MYGFAAFSLHVVVTQPVAAKLDTRRYVPKPPNTNTKSTARVHLLAKNAATPVFLEMLPLTLETAFLGAERGNARSCFLGAYRFVVTGRPGCLRGVAMVSLLFMFYEVVAPLCDNDECLYSK